MRRDEGDAGAGGVGWLRNRRERHCNQPAATDRGRATPEPPTEVVLPTDASVEAIATPPPAAALPTDAPENATLEPPAVPQVPTDAPAEVTVTLVAVQFGTFPQETNAAGETVAWNELVRTEGIPNAGFFVSSASEGVEIRSLDCQIVFDGQVVYQHEATEDNLTLFAPENLPDEASSDFNWVFGNSRGESHI